MKRLALVSIICLLGINCSTNKTFTAKSPPVEKTGGDEKQISVTDESAVRANEKNKFIGFAAEEDCIEIGKFYHALSSGVIASKSNVVCYSVLQEVEKLSLGPATVWQMTEAPPRFFKFQGKYVAADGIYTFENGTNGLVMKRVGIIPTFEMKMRPIPEPPVSPRRPGEIKI